MLRARALAARENEEVGEMSESLRNNRKHVVWPNLVRVNGELGAFGLYIPGHGTSLDVEQQSSALVESVLNGFVEASTLHDFRARHPEVPEELLELMLRSCFVVDVEELPFLEHGFLRPSAVPLGEPCAWSDLPAFSEAGRWAVIGVPVDMSAAGSGGARHGPSEIRKVVNGQLISGQGDVVDHELSRLYPALELALCDLGDVDPDGGRMDHVGRRLMKVTHELFAHGMRPLTLGGDHSLSHYVLSSAISQGERFGIIHFDAHADMGPSRVVSHANVFSQAIESPNVVSILQIGLRGIERISPYAQRVPCAKRHVISASEARKGGARRALEALDRSIPYYLSFDIDCIDAAQARETGTPLFAGLSFEQCLELVDYVARSFSLLGADFVEVASHGTAVNAAALMAASLLQRVLLGEAEFEPLSTDVYLV
jgi:arginase family enzyme